MQDPCQVFLVRLLHSNIHANIFLCNIEELEE
jgi:hypothetical protein